MFSFIKKIELGIANKEHFKIKNNESVVVSIGTRLSRVDLFTDNKILIHDFEREIQELIPLNSNELIIFMGKKSKLLNLRDWRMIKDDEFEKRRISPITPTNGKTFIRIQDDVNPDITRRGFYDIKEKKILWESEILNNPILINDSIFSNSITKIERFDFRTGELLWSRPINETGKYFSKPDKKWIEGEVDKFLGIHKELLWVCLGNGLLIGMDVKSGAVIHQVGGPKQYPAELHMMEETRAQNFFYNHYSIFDNENGKIIRLWHAGYSNADFDWNFEVDLNVQEPNLTISNVENTTGQPFIIDGNPCPVWPFDDKYIYVCNYRDYKMALFNRKTKKIEWVHEMEVEPSKRSFIIKMEVYGNRWYILDNSKTLFIYEKLKP